MDDHPGDAEIEHLNRRMLAPAFRDKLEANHQSSWESLQTECHPLLLHRAQLWVPYLFRLAPARTLEEENICNKWYDETFVVPTFAKFRTRCVIKPDGDTRKRGVPSKSPAKYLLKILQNLIFAKIPSTPDFSLVLEFLEPHTSEGAGTFQDILRREQVQQLRMCIERLPDDKQKLLDEAYLLNESGITQAQLATQRGVHRATYAEWLHVTRDLLRHCIESKT